MLNGYQRRGIGSTLIEHVCDEAFRNGARKIALLASAEGRQLYAQREFIEVARFGYWYRSFQRTS